MPTPLTYDLRVIGMASVKQALRSVERSVIQSNQRIASRLGGPGARRGGLSSTRDPAAMAARQAAKADAMLAKADQAAAVRKSRAIAKGHAAQIKAIESEKMARIKADNAAFKAQERAQLRAGRAVAARRGAFSKSVLGAAGTSARRTVGGIGRFALASGGLLGGFAAGSAIANASRVERGAVGLANQAFRVGGTEDRGTLARQVTERARTVGAESGFGAEGVIGAMRQFVAISGDVKGAMSMAGYMADIADASGADIGDVGRTGGQIQQNLMMSRGLSSEAASAETQKIMAAVAGQAKVGSIEFADLAQQMGKLISSTARFDGQASELATTMGAISQLAISGAASSPEEAMTAILRLSDDIIQNAGKFEKQGVNVWSDKTKTKLRKPEEIITEVLDATKGDLSKASNLFGLRSMKAFAPFQTLYSEKSKEAGGGEAGHKAGMAALTGLLESVRGATMTEGEVKGSAKAMRATSGKQFEIAIEQFNQAIGTSLLPAVTQLVPKFVALIPVLTSAAEYLGKFLDYLSKNPLEAIGRLIALKVSLDIMGAGIGRAVATAITKSIMSSPSTGGTGGTTVAGGGTVTKTTAGGVMVAVTLGAAAGNVIAEAIYQSATRRYDKENDIENKAGQDIYEAGAAGDKEKLEKIRQAAVDRMRKHTAAADMIGFSDKPTDALDTAKSMLDPLAPVIAFTKTLVGEGLGVAGDERSRAGTAESQANAATRTEEAVTASANTKEFEAQIMGTTAALSSLEKMLRGIRPPGGSPNTGDSPTVPKVN